MYLFLRFLSDASVLFLLTCIAVRAVRELILPCPFQDPPAYKAESTLPSWCIPLLALAILWLGSLFGHVAAGGRLSDFFPHFLARFTGEGDAPRYLFLAEHGYVADGENVINIVFYPLYPLLIRALAPIFGGSFEVSGIVLSQLCYAASALVFYKLAQQLCRSPVTALAAFVLYPFGFFSLGVFSEGLFLLLSVSCLYLLFREKWLWAGLIGFLCALTRVQGILTLLPGVYLAWRSIRKRGFRAELCAVLLPLLGLVLYLGLNRIVCGDFLAFRYYESQEPWWQTAQWLGKTVAQQWERALEYAGIAKWIYWPQLALFFIALALLLFACHRRLDNAWILYGTAYLGMCYTASWLISGGRYMLGCLPMFLAVGEFSRPRGRILLLSAEFLLWLLYNCYFMQGQCIM